MVAALTLAVLACGGPAAAPPAAAPPAVERVAAAVRHAASDEAFLDEVQERTFRFFWETAHPETGLVPDRWPTESFSSVAAVGFGLTALPIGAERGWVTREEAAERALLTLRTLARLPQGPEPAGRAGHRGFFYHFLDPATGLRFERVELSTVDTALLLAGALVCRGWFDRDDPAEREIRALAGELVRRVEWDWAQPNPPAIALGWHPEKGFVAADWRGYNEAMIVYLLALGSPTHPVEPAAWAEWTSRYRVATFGGREYLQFGPLFGHQYSHVWVDFRGIEDEFNRHAGFDYFENSRRATLAQRAWAIDNPRGWRGLGEDVWGVTACDGPVDAELEVELEIDGEIRRERRRFWTYAGRGVGAFHGVDDGTVAPTAAGGSVPFAPEVAVPALRAMRERYGEHLWGRYGFFDAFNPTFTSLSSDVRHGRVVPGAGWFDTDYLGIDQGPILAMIENHRSGLVWRVMRRDPDLRRGLERAGVTGGWLDDPAP